MSNRIRLLIVAGALAALSLLGIGTALAAGGSDSAGSGQSGQVVQPVQQEQPAQPDYDCPNKGGQTSTDDVSQQV